MTSERWEHIWTLFNEALALPESERAAFLDRVCAGEGELRAELDSLLRADSAAHPLLDVGAAELARLMPEAPPAVGRTIGPYRLLREIGRGGMGVVYLAERGDIEKKVALKLVRGGPAAPESTERFLLERRLLARLEHPYIARLLDAGVTEDGVPYFVMEYVEGEPIDRFCDERRLPIRARLKLFGKVCEAVQYAHRNLVVHRDLKPSNILVTREGEPKLLDFGIAKLLEGDAGQEGLTGTGVRLMTPDYAAPEQVRGEATTTATDVYALGMVLYELLTGHRPYRLHGRSLGEIERLVLEQDPPRPSTVVRRTEEDRRGDGTTERITPDRVGQARGTHPERLRREIAGDLDTIVLKAVEKRPERRYTSVQQLGDDLDRHLRGLPVSARPDTWAYRTRKMVRRHRWGVGVAAAAVLVLLGFTAVNAAQSQRIARERDKAEQVSEFLVELFAVSDPGVSRGETVTARQLLDAGAARIDRELAAQPEVRAQLLGAIGRAYTGLGLYDEAKPPLEAALSIRRQLHRADHPDIATSLFDLALLLRDRAEFAASESLFRESLAMRRRLFGRQHPAVVESTNGLGLVLRDQGKFREAEQMYREALATGPRVFDGPDLQRSFTYNGLGASLFGQGRYAEAEHFYREALRTIREAGGANHPNEFIDLNNIAQALQAQGNLEEAERFSREAVERARRVLGDEHPVYAMNLWTLAWLRRKAGDLRGAEAMLRETLDIQRRSLPDGHSRTAETLLELGKLLVQTGRSSEAEPLLQEALASRRAAFPAGHRAIVATQSALGACLTALERYEEAEPLLLEAYRVLRQTYGERDELTRTTWDRLAALYEARDRPDKVSQLNGPR